VILRFARNTNASTLPLMSFSRCFSSLGCPELSLEGTFALARKHAVRLVELRALGGMVDLPAYFSMQFGSPAQLAIVVRDTPVKIVAFNASLHLVGATNVERDELAALAPWADAVGVKWLRVFDGGRQAAAAEIAEAAETIRWWRELRRERGWQTDVIVETHDSLITAAAVGRFLEAIPRATILWDSHHTWRKGGEDPVYTWRAISRSVVHVHVKDSINVPSARHPFTYVLPGDGEFPIAPLMAALRADKFAGPVSLEWEKMWHPYLPSLDTALATAAARKWW
jgi:sugar phosphate isomerase/epimerase